MASRAGTSKHRTTAGGCNAERLNSLFLACAVSIHAVPKLRAFSCSATSPILRRLLILLPKLTSSARAVNGAGKMAQLVTAAAIMKGERKQLLQVRLHPPDASVKSGEQQQRAVVRHA